MTIASWHYWSTRLLFFSLTFVIINAKSPSFENAAVVRTVELDGALTHVTTRYSVRALEDGANKYIFALGEDDGKLTTWIQAKVKGGDALVLESNGLDSERYVATRFKTLCHILHWTVAHGHILPSCQKH